MPRRTIEERARQCLQTLRTKTTDEYFNDSWISCWSLKCCPRYSNSFPFWIQTLSSWLVTSLFADLKTWMEQGRPEGRKENDYRCCRKMEGSSRVVDHPLTPIAKVQQRDTTIQLMNNSDCNGCKSKEMHIPVEGNFDNTAENVVKVTCRRMQKDQFESQQELLDELENWDVHWTMDH